MDAELWDWLSYVQMGPECCSRLVMVRAPGPPQWNRAHEGTRCNTGFTWRAPLWASMPQVRCSQGFVAPLRKHGHMEDPENPCSTPDTALFKHSHKRHKAYRRRRRTVSQTTGSFPSGCREKTLAAGLPAHYHGTPQNTVNAILASLVGRLLGPRQN